MTDSMTKYNHRMTAEESISNFILHLESDAGYELQEEQKDWLYRKGREVFDSYYIDMVVNVNLSTQDDKDLLMDYFAEIQLTLGSMFAHIMLIEFKLHLVDEKLI